MEVVGDLSLSELFLFERLNDEKALAQRLLFLERQKQRQKFFERFRGFDLRAGAHERGPPLAILWNHTASLVERAAIHR